MADMILRGFKDNKSRLMIDSALQNDDDIWQVMLGWPDSSEIESAKAQGCSIEWYAVSEAKGKRSAAQNRLYWGWLTDFERTDINEHAGKTKDEWADFFKGESLIKIYERDNHVYAETMSNLREVYRCGMKEQAKHIRKFVLRETSTTEASVEQFSEHLRFIEQWAHSRGIRLRTDAKLYEMAMSQ